MKIRFYLHSCWSKNFKQVALWPVIHFTHNTIANKSVLMALSANVLIWDFGFTIERQK